MRRYGKYVREIKMKRETKRKWRKGEQMVGKG